MKIKFKNGTEKERRHRERKIADHIRKYFEAAEKEEQRQAENADWKKVGRPFPESHD